MKTKIYATLILVFTMVLSNPKSYSQTIICKTGAANINAVGENAFNSYVVKFKKQGKHLNTDLKMIPVVIHVIYRNKADSLKMSMARIQGQIDATNRQLRRLNANADETRPIFLPVAADCNIQVCLATVKPDRSAFNGVIYHKYPGFVESRDLATVRAATVLDPDRYLNVWVTPNSQFAAAVFPWQRTSKLDGFYIGSLVFGVTGSDLQPENTLGVTFTHELSHYLGVLHTFDQSRGYQYQCDRIYDGSVGDFCSDTPLDWELPLFMNSCNDGERFCVNNDPEDSFFVQSENYMYYAFDSCLNMFSKDQRARMRACLDQLRKQLTLPSNLKRTGVNCTDIRGNCTTCATPFASSAGNDDLQANQLAAEKKITIFPNPTNGIIRIGYNDLPVKRNMIITVYDETGQKLKEVHSKTAINELNLGAVPEGTYYIRITIDDVSLTKYIMKY
jgi:hypothetical protein